MRLNFSSYNLFASILLICTIILGSLLIDGNSVPDTYSSNMEFDMEKNYLGENYRDRLNQDQGDSDTSETPDDLLNELLEALRDDRIDDGQNEDLFPESSSSSNNSENVRELNSSENEEQLDSETRDLENRTESESSDDETFLSGIMKLLQNIYPYIISTFLAVGTIISLYIASKRNLSVSDIILMLKKVYQNLKNHILNYITRSMSKASILLHNILKRSKKIFPEINRIAENIFAILEDLFLRFLGKNDGKKQETSKIIRLWRSLKSYTGVSGNKFLTPKEVKKRAINKGFNVETVDKIVNAFRLDKYSSKGYSENLNSENLEKSLEDQAE